MLEGLFLLPSKHEIIAEATKLFFQRNGEMDCYNTPEVWNCKKQDSYEKPKEG